MMYPNTRFVASQYFITGQIVSDRMFAKGLGFYVKDDGLHNSKPSYKVEYVLT